jgi:hypothetical protein
MPVWMPADAEMGTGGGGGGRASGGAGSRPGSSAALPGPHMAVHRCLTFLGDLCRYQSQVCAVHAVISAVAQCISVVCAWAYNMVHGHMCAGGLSSVPSLAVFASLSFRRPDDAVASCMYLFLCLRLRLWATPSQNI